jgi:N-glycosylase/DNA lyase
LNLEDIKKARTRIGFSVAERIGQFETLGKRGKVRFNFNPFEPFVFEASIFTELMFCLSTANSSAKLGLRIQSSLDEGAFKNLSEQELRVKLRELGHRFYPQRAKYMVLAREKFDEVMEILGSSDGTKTKREKLVSLIKGFGLKEASHFLRNIGYMDVAIVDRHISRYLFEKGLVRKRKTITRRVYLECELALEQICKELGISQGELDLYIFYIKAGKVLK